MGDHRASIKISMEFHGVKDKTDMWINYFPNGCACNMDQRVVDFFNSVYERGMAAYDEETEKYFREQNKERIEAEEKAEYERLKSKYATKHD